MAGIFLSKPFTDYTVEDYAMAMWPCCGDAASDRDPLLHASRCDMAREGRGRDDRECHHTSGQGVYDSSARHP